MVPAPDGMPACVGLVLRGVAGKCDVVVSNISVGVAEVGGALNGNDRIFLRVGKEDARAVLADKLHDAHRVKVGGVRLASAKQPRIALWMRLCVWNWIGNPRNGDDARHLVRTEIHPCPERKMSVSLP